MLFLSRASPMSHPVLSASAQAFILKSEGESSCTDQTLKGHLYPGFPEPWWSEPDLAEGHCFPVSGACWAQSHYPQGHVFTLSCRLSWSSQSTFWVLVGFPIVAVCKSCCVHALKACGESGCFIFPFLTPLEHLIKSRAVVSSPPWMSIRITCIAFFKSQNRHLIQNSNILKSRLLL